MPMRRNQHQSLYSSHARRNAFWYSSPFSADDQGDTVPSPIDPWP